MLIVNDDQLHLAGIASLEERCIYCSKRLATYPLWQKSSSPRRKLFTIGQDTWGDSFAHLAMIFLLQEALGMLSG